MMAARRGPRDYFAAALDILEEDGFSRLTAVALCERLGVTRGSFYHHFPSFDVFVDRFLVEWEERYTTRPLAEVATIGDEASQLRMELDLARALPHGAEAAIRVWGTTDARARRACHRVDRRRIEALVELYRGRGLPDAAARIYSELAVAALVGLQLLDQPVDTDRVQRILGQIQRDVVARRTAAR